MCSIIMVTICLMIRQEKDKITKKDKIGKIVTGVTCVGSSPNKDIDSLNDAET